MDIKSPLNGTRTPEKRWLIGGASVLCAAALVGGAAMSASAATSQATPTPGSQTTKAQAGHPGKAAMELRTELRTVIKNGPHAADLAVAGAISLTDTFAGFEAKLPAPLQNDLKTIAGASAADRAGDAAKISSSALDGTYGTKIQTMAKKIQAAPVKKPARTPTTPTPTTPTPGT